MKSEFKQMFLTSVFFMVVIFILHASVSFSAGASCEPSKAPDINEIGRKITIYGTAAPRTKVNVPARVAGVIDSAPPLEGTEIKSGEVILTIDRIDYELGAELTRRQYKMAVISNNQAGLENKRMTKLYEANATTAQMRDNASYASQTGQASLDCIGTQVKMAEKALRETKILSPIDGIISARHCEAGEFIDKGNPVVEVIDISAIKANMKIPEQYVNCIKPGELVELTTDGCSGRKFDGRVCSVIPLGDASTHSFDIMVIIDNAGREIKPGMFLKGTINIQFTGASVKAQGNGEREAQNIAR